MSSTSSLGTESRDLWKAAAHAYSSSPNQALLDRAQIGALCGNSEPLLQIATSWEDRLWALLKGYVDVTMEEHIRSGKEAFSTIFQFLERILIENIESIGSLVSQLQGCAETVRISCTKWVKKFALINCFIPKNQVASFTQGLT